MLVVKSYWSISGLDFVFLVLKSLEVEAINLSIASLEVEDAVVEVGSLTNRPLTNRNEGMCQPIPEHLVYLSFQSRRLDQDLSIPVGERLVHC